MMGDLTHADTKSYRNAQLEVASPVLFVPKTDETLSFLAHFTKLSEVKHSQLCTLLYMDDRFFALEEN